ncbi:MAG: hypothetical protein J6113_09465, partial [Lachnospiraceae bacterium]|nr:hypothetical protein [Lachnospiraceae bacterium]
VSENEELKTKIEQLTAEKTALTSEKDQLAAEKAGLAAEKDSLTAEKTTLTAEKDALNTEKETLSAKVAELDDTIKSFENPSLDKAAAAMGENYRVTDITDGDSKTLIIWCSITIAEADNSYSIGEDLGKKVALMMQQRWFDYDHTFVNFELEQYGTVSSMEFFGTDPTNNRSVVWEDE